MLINKEEVKEILKQYIGNDENSLDQYTEFIVNNAEKIVLNMIKASGQRVSFYKYTIDTKA